MKRHHAVLAALIATTAVAAALVNQAQATYPGSTDGRIVFGATVDVNADVYSVLPNGEALQRLTDDPGMDACPAYSADGKTIAWCHQSGGTTGPFEIWAMKQNGTDKRQLTNLGGSGELARLLPRRLGDRLPVQARHSAAAGLARRRRRQRRPCALGIVWQRPPSRLLAGRHEGRLHQRPNRAAAGLADECRRKRPGAAHVRRGSEGPASRLEPRRRADRLRRADGGDRRRPLD